MQTMLTMHAPVYRKQEGGFYVIQGFLELTASVHPNAPVREVWESLMSLKSAPCMLFCAGDKTTYMALEDNTPIRETWNAPYEQQFPRVGGWRDSRGRWCTQFSTSVVFTHRGLLCSLPLPDYCQTFLSVVPGANMQEHLQREAGRQRAAYARLRDNVQFLDVYREEVLGSQRMEGGRVGEKRKRNAA